MLGLITVTTALLLGLGFVAGRLWGWRLP